VTYIIQIQMFKTRLSKIKILLYTSIDSSDVQMRGALPTLRHTLTSAFNAQSAMCFRLLFFCNQNSFRISHLPMHAKWLDHNPAWLSPLWTPTGCCFFLGGGGVLPIYCRNHMKHAVGHLNNLHAKKMTWSKFHAQGRQILGATVQNAVHRDLWTPELNYDYGLIDTLMKERVGK
jgi:hypothetical protein